MQILFTEGGALMLEFRALSKTDMETIRNWRHEFMETLRTPYLLTAEQQAAYYESVICNRLSTTRYWGFWSEKEEFDDDDLPTLRGQLIGYGGIENIQWENRLGEISVLIAPKQQGKGYGRQAVEGILLRAFGLLNLDNVYGECYQSSGAVPFWEKLVREKHGYTTLLPNRKFWNGEYYNSLYFNFFRRPE
jgi:RimJ/RimL family protein N-acetyltransferase